MEESFLGQVLDLLDLSPRGPYIAILTVWLDTPNILAVYETFLLLFSNTFRTNSLAFSDDIFWVHDMI